MVHSFSLLTGFPNGPSIFRSGASLTLKIMPFLYKKTSTRFFWNKQSIYTRAIIYMNEWKRWLLSWILLNYQMFEAINIHLDSWENINSRFAQGLLHLSIQLLLFYMALSVLYLLCKGYQFLQTMHHTQRFLSFPPHFFLHTTFYQFLIPLILEVVNAWYSSCWVG